jgi:hypothetical protein
MRSPRAAGDRWLPQVRRCALVFLVAAVGCLVWAALAGGVQPAETYEGVVARDEPAAQFRFGDASGSSTIADSAGSYTATNHGVTLGGEGPFPGSDSGSFGGETYASLPGDPLREATAFTVEGWLDWGGGNSYGQPLFDFGSAAGDHMYLTPASSASKHPPLFEIVTPSGAASVKTTKALVTGAWQYVTITEASSEGSSKLTLYLNGAVAAETPGVTITPASLGSSVPDDYLGKSLSGAPSLSASLSNLAFYRKALTAKQVEEHFHDAEFPVSIAPPTVSGTPKEGSPLTAAEGSWTGAATIKYAFQWERCTSLSVCSAISKATKATYMPVSEDVDKTLRVAITATNGAGRGGANSEQTVTVEGMPTNSTPPVISGEAKVGQQLTVSEGNWRAFPAPSFGYLWESCVKKACTAAEGKDRESNYRITGSELGDTLQAAVTASNALGEATVKSGASAKVVAGPPVSVEAPTVSGLTSEGQELTAGAGTWAGSEPIAYTNFSWLRCTGKECKAIEHASGPTHTSYALTTADVGATIEVQVAAKNSVGEATATSPASAVVAPGAPTNTAAPSITGIAEEGQALTATPGSWSGAVPMSFAYQWQSCSETGEDCADIEGEESSSYRAGPGDVGNTLRAVVTASNEAGAVSVASQASGVINTVVAAPLSLAPPEISGTAQPGQTLRANAGTWTGSPPISYTYQWEQCDRMGESCDEIAEATDSSYRLNAGIVGGTLRVVVTARNAAGVASRISGASAAISEASSACTDTWIGSPERSFGSWQEGADWSTGSPPGPTDVACAGAETDIIVSEGNYEVGALEDAGELTITGPNSSPGSLEFMDAAEPSRIASLELSSTAATLTGAGSVYVSNSFFWGSGTMSGSGATVIESTATGEADSEAESEPERLSGGRTLVNEGTLTFSSFDSGALLYMSEGARIDNEGTVVDNSEASLPQIESEGSGAAPAILNAGTFEKTEHEGTSTVAVPFTNDGTVSAHSGKLKFTGGGVAEQGATGAWSVESGASVVLAGGTFLIGETVDLSQVIVEGATVTRVAAPVDTAPPSIVGPAQDGETLTADQGGWSGPGPITFAYRWQRCNDTGQECQDIANATSGSYVPGAGEIGATMRVLVTATNPYGQTQVPSSVSGVVATPPAPASTGPPTIEGLAQDGSELDATAGSWSAAAPVSYSYQWESCGPTGEDCASIEYATAPNYQLSEGDIGSTLRVVVTATNTGGSTQATSTASPVIQAEPVSERKPPTISGPADDHAVIYADPGSWIGTETQISYQWESCDESGTECAPVEGATASEYDLAEGDVGTRLRVRVGASNARDALSDVSATTPVVGGPAALADISRPSTSGTPQNGQVLSANPGSWAGNGAISYLYQWQSCNELGYSCESIAGANAVSYAPPPGQDGHSLRVLVSASEEGHSLSESSPPTQAVAASRAPVIEQAPAVAGISLAGQTLTAQTGIIAGEGPISYTYQWQRCTGSGDCADIEGAIHNSYTLTGEDIGSRLLVVTTATDTGGSTAAVATPTATVGPEALLELSAPSIAGVVQSGAALSADPGIWSAEGPVSYTYQWETCSSAGDDCARLEGATEANYLVTSGTLGSTLRVKVTATSPLGSKTAISAPTATAAGGEVSTEEAQNIAQQADPALLAHSTTATLEGQNLAPALTDSGEELTANSTLTTATVSKEAAGAFAVNTPAGEISLAPVETSPHAATPPTVVNSTAALLANAWAATDTISRPEPLGITDLLDIRAPEAPHSFSWEVGLGPDEELQQLPDGAVAIVETPEETTQQSSIEEAGQPRQVDEAREGPAQTSEEKAEAEQAEAERHPEHEEELPLPTLSAAPTSSTSPGEAAPGEPQPQNTQTSYETAKSAMSYAEAQTAGNALMTIAPPDVTDAEGNIVPATLTTAGNTITLTITPRRDTPYPLLADTIIAAPTNRQSAERDPVKYGISDPTPKESGHIDEHFNENGAVEPKFDPRLYDGPSHTTRHMRTARLIVPYDIFITPITKASAEYRSTEQAVLKSWMEKVTKEGFEPYITISKDYSEEPCGEKENPKCEAPSIGQYRQAVTTLMEEVIGWHTSKGWKLVKLWGAWNEPDEFHDPLHEDAELAAQFWEVAQTGLHKIVHHYPCPGCTVVAGEFSTFYPEYSSCYRSVLLYSDCRNHSYKRYWTGKPRDPAAWGFHDYADLLHRDNTVAQHFAQFAKTRLEKPRLFMSEAGVELQDGEAEKGETELGDVFTPEDEKGTKRSLQLQAAEEFLKLPQGLSYPVDRMYYYQYTSPSVAEQEKHVFDSALVEEEPGAKGQPHCMVATYEHRPCPFEKPQSGERRERPAYCVLAYEDHRCPPMAITGPWTGFNPGIEAPAAEITATVNADGTPTEYRFEYGPTTSLGSRTPLEKLGGLNNETVGFKLTFTEIAGDCNTAVAYFRLEATNETGTRYGQVSEVRDICVE